MSFVCNIKVIYSLSFSFHVRLIWENIKTYIIISSETVQNEFPSNLRCMFCHLITVVSRFKGGMLWSELKLLCDLILMCPMFYKYVLLKWLKKPKKKYICGDSFFESMDKSQLKNKHIEVICGVYNTIYILYCKFFIDFWVKMYFPISYKVIM